jgi:hypothetical protein
VDAQVLVPCQGPWCRYSHLLWTRTLRLPAATARYLWGEYLMLRGLMLLALTACPTAIHPPKLRRRAMQDLNRLPPALRGGTVQHLPAGTAVGEALPVPQRLAHNSPQRQGPGWLNDLLTPEGRKVMWDGKAHIPSSDPSQTCVWTQYKSPGQHTQEGMQMCLHSTQDLVSGAIQREGYWGDCDSLAQIWNRQQAGDAARSPDWPLAQDGTFYLEVGTNIGAVRYHSHVPASFAGGRGGRS